ncbi:MAG: hypothetical protein ACW99A_08055 [Candidatus Kariarchaeaceae archaeon]
MKSIIDSQISASALELWLELANRKTEIFQIDDLHTELDEMRSTDLQELIESRYLIAKKDKIVFPPRDVFLKLLLSSVVTPYLIDLKSVEMTTDPVKNYLVSVQKQLSHFETEGKKSFLTLRTMVEKIVMQAKNYLNKTFESSIVNLNDNNQWINIPHVSPIGIYEPIGDIRKKFEVIMKELDLSIVNLIESHLTQLADLIQPLKIKISTLEQNSDLSQSLKSLNNNVEQIDNIIQTSDKTIRNDIKKFSEEVHNAVKEQFSQLEENLGKDLIEQFDAIERLNELDPQRIRIKLEQTVNELNVHLNSIYSRLLREINTLQLNLDVSKINIILTNEAGKLLKKITISDSTSRFSDIQSLVSDLLDNLHD